MPIRRDKNWTQARAQMATIVRQAVGAGAVTMENTIVNKLSTPGRGRYYVRKGLTSNKILRQANFIGELDKGTVFTILRREFLRVKSAKARGRNVRMRNMGDLGIHRASKFPDPPAANTGHLRQSIGIDVSRLNQPQPTARIGTKTSVKVPYAKWLEYGTRKMAPRKFMKPSVKDARPDILNIFRTMLRRIGKVT